MEFEPNPDISIRDETLHLLSFIADTARGFMEPPHPYHWWEHIEYSFNFAMTKCDAYDEADTPVNRLMVGCAILFHDANISHDLPEGFNTKEEYSAYIAGQVLQTFGFEEDFILGVMSCIETTHDEGTPETPEEKLTCMADIANIFDQYDFFALNSFKVMKELLYTTDKIGSFREFRNITNKVVRTYLFKDLVIDPSVDTDVEGNPIYRVLGIRNLEKFMKSSSAQLRATLKRCGYEESDLMELIPEPRKTASHIPFKNED